MTRTLASLVAILALLVAYPVAPSATNQEPAILPLVQNGEGFCTAVSVNEADGLWLTAGHCIAHIDWNKGPVTLAGQGALPVYIAPADDLGLYQANQHGTAAKLAKKGPNVGEPIWVKGFPLGWPLLITTQGFLAAQRLQFLDGSWPTSDVYDVTIAPGNSGSPVFNAHGELVGIVWGATSYGHALVTPLAVIQRLIGSYVG